MVEMTAQSHLDRLKECVASFDADGLVKACREALAAGITPSTLVIDGMAKGMDVVGAKYEAGEYFLSELIMAGETMTAGMKVVEPLLKGGTYQGIGTVAIGTVSGDLHDIGKNILAMLLTAAGFDVIDLGVDVPADRFVQTLRTQKPDILAMSALLTVAIPEMENVIRKIDEAELRPKLKLIVVGGTPLTEDFAKGIGADAYGPTAVAGVKICKEIASKRETIK
jgi:5-methyltetrahydrofolate--homocysteine methyltransferase